MTKDFSLNYEFSTWKLQAQNWMSKQKTIASEKDLPVLNQASQQTFGRSYFVGALDKFTYYSSSFESSWKTEFELWSKIYILSDAEEFLLPL